MKKYFILLLAMGFVLINCKKNDDPAIDAIQVEPEEEQQEEQQEEPKTRGDYPVQDFMWQTMNFYYLWQGDVANLADSSFSDIEDPSYVQFLGSRMDPADFYYADLCYMHRNIVGNDAAVDRFSAHRENYKDLVQIFQGITKSNGLEFGLSLYGEGEDVLGFVNYIVKDSDASTKDIARGDIFTGVNGISLNLDNYIELLFGDADTYTLNMVDIVDNTLVPNGKEVTLTKFEGLEEDPILVTNIVERGDKKIAYLMYNQFVGGSGERLNEVFADFKAANVTDLVLDLRYNSGGSGYTAAILASLIIDADESKIFFRDRYNSKFEAILDPEDVENPFYSTTGTAFGNSDAPLNNLNLNKVYILATDSSASASELVMVGLEPYIDVVHIGSTTVGKNQGSSTYVDDPENGNWYDPDREDQINPDNQWGLQPIIVIAENSAGFSEYTNGLVPDIPLLEDIANLGVLGDPEEPLFAKAIEEITGISSKRGFDVQMPVDLVKHSKMFTPFWDQYQMAKAPASLKEHFIKR